MPYTLRNPVEYFRNALTLFIEDIQKPIQWRDAQAAFYEFVGTTGFLFVALASCKGATQEETIHPQVDATNRCASSFGLSLFVFVSIFFRVTGAALNPCISLALYLVEAINFWRFVMFFVAQLVGGIVAAALVKGLVYAGPSVSVETNLAGGTTLAQGVFLEAIGTGALIAAVLMLAIDSRAKSGEVTAPLGIAGALWVGHLLLIDKTGAGLNPARSFGPAVISGFESDHWVYWVGPFLGTLVTVLFIKHLNQTEYWLISGSDKHGKGVILIPQIDENGEEKHVLAETTTMVVDGKEIAVVGDALDEEGIRRIRSNTSASRRSIDSRMEEGGISRRGRTASLISGRKSFSSMDKFSPPTSPTIARTRTPVRGGFPIQPIQSFERDDVEGEPKMMGEHTPEAVRTRKRSLSPTTKVHAQPGPFHHLTAQEQQEQRLQHLQRQRERELQRPHLPTIDSSVGPPDSAATTTQTQEPRSTTSPGGIAYVPPALEIADFKNIKPSKTGHHRRSTSRG